MGAQGHAVDAAPRGKRPSTHFIGSQSGRMWKISPRTGFRTPDRPARSEKLYRVLYPRPSSTKENYYKFLITRVKAGGKHIFHCNFPIRI